MGSDTLPKVESETKVRAPQPWWVDLVKWATAQFLFPAAVCAFLLYNHHTVGKEMIKVLQTVSQTLTEVKASLDRRGP
jgi:hypothetical protein